MKCCSLVPGSIDTDAVAVLDSHDPLPVVHVVFSVEDTFPIPLVVLPKTIVPVLPRVETDSASEMKFTGGGSRIGCVSVRQT